MVNIKDVPGWQEIWKMLKKRNLEKGISIDPTWDEVKQVQMGYLKSISEGKEYELV